MRDEHISRGEATRRTAGIAVLCGLAIAWLVALPYARVQGPQIAALLGAAIVAAVRLAAALAVAGGRTERAPWRGAVALGAIAVGGWVVTRAVAVPGVAEDAGHWTSTLGLGVAGLGLALAALGAAGAGRPPGPAALRGLAGATAVALALVPAGAMSLIALRPAPGHHHGTAPASITRHRFHTATSPSSPAAFRPGFGGHAGHYVYANATRPHLPPWALALAFGAAVVFVSTAGGALPPPARAPPPPPPPRRARPPLLLRG